MSVETDVVAAVHMKITTTITIDAVLPPGAGRAVAAVLLRVAATVADTTTAAITPVSVAVADTINRHHRYHVTAKSIVMVAAVATQDPIGDPTAATANVATESATMIDTRIEEADHRTVGAARAVEIEAAGRGEEGEIEVIPTEAVVTLAEGMDGLAGSGVGAGEEVTRPAVAANAIVGAAAEIAEAGTGEKDDIARGTEEEAVGGRNTTRGHRRSPSREGGTEPAERGGTTVVIAAAAAARVGEGIAPEATTAVFVVGGVTLGVTVGRRAARKQKNCIAASHCPLAKLVPVVDEVAIIPSCWIVSGTATARAIIIGDHPRDAVNLAQANTAAPTTTSSAVPRAALVAGAEATEIGSKIVTVAAVVRMVAAATTMTKIRRIKNAVERITIKQITLGTVTRSTASIQGVTAVVELVAIGILIAVAEIKTKLDGETEKRVGRDRCSGCFT